MNRDGESVPPDPNPPKPEGKETVTVTIRLPRRSGGGPTAEQARLTPQGLRAADVAPS
jgi:hypothetical protein